MLSLSDSPEGLFFKITPMVDKEKQRKYAQNLAVASSCCGVTGETVLTDSAVVILFASALGAGDMLSLLTTSVLPLFNGLFIIPAALIAAKTGSKKLISAACIIATIAYLIAPFAAFTKFPIAVFIGAIICFALALPGFISGWFPLLDTFLLPEERTGYLGKMRLFHQLSAVIFLLITGLLIGKTPSLLTMQCVLWCGAFIFGGRLLFISMIPDFSALEQKERKHGGLIRAVKNRELTIFSIYQFVLNFLICGTIPVATLYMKNDLRLADNRIVIIGGIALAGMSLGYLSAKRLRQKFSLHTLCLLLHLAAIVIPLLLFFAKNPVLLSMILVAAAFLMALASILCNVWMMDLAAPDNKIMAMAWSGMFFYCGWGCSRLFPSLFLGKIFPFLDGIVPWSGCRTIFLLWAVLLLPALFLFFRIPRRSSV